MKLDAYFKGAEFKALGQLLYIAESDEARYTLYLSDVDTIENSGHSRIILEGNTLAVRFNNSLPLREQLLLKVNTE